MSFSTEILRRSKNYYIRLMLRGVNYSDRFWRLRLFYLITNPWHLDTPAQRYRFLETNRFLMEQGGPVGSLLEIGCGEGHQSIYLKKACDRLTGLDVSRRAVKRARRRCPEGRFIVGDIFSAALESGAPYDLVVSCEVLYYIQDVPAAIKRFETLGHACLVTYTTRETERLDPIMLRMPGVAMATFQYQDRSWRAAYWSKPFRRLS